MKLLALRDFHATFLVRFLSDPRVKAIADEYCALCALKELLEQLLNLDEE
jgi:hypothetical protein